MTIPSIAASSVFRQRHEEGALASAAYPCLAPMLCAGMESDEIRPDLDTDRAATLLAVVFRGLGLEALRSVNPPQLLVKEASEMLARWLRT